MSGQLIITDIERIDSAGVLLDHLKIPAAEILAEGRRVKVYTKERLGYEIEWRCAEGYTCAEGVDEKADLAGGLLALDMSAVAEYVECAEGEAARSVGTVECHREQNGWSIHRDGQPVGALAETFSTALDILAIECEKSLDPEAATALLKFLYTKRGTDDKLGE